MQLLQTEILSAEEIMSEKDNIKQQIINHNRRLQKLKQKQALYGLDVQPHVLMEIEDIEAELESLQAQLKTLDKKSARRPRERTDTSTRLRPDTNNPFHYPGPVPPESFIGHRWAVDFCRERLTTRKPQNIAIIGERRIGKTSLLHYLREFSGQKAWGQHLCLSIDLQLLSSSLTATNFWKELLYELRASLDGTSPVVEQIINLSGQPDVSGQEFRWLIDSYCRLHAKRSLIILLDEFELIFRHYNEDIKNLLMSLRAVTQDPDNDIILITATREPLQQVCQPFLKETGYEFDSNFRTCHLAPFDEAETRYVVQKLLARTIIKFTDPEMNYIWQLSQWQDQGAFPIFIQVAASLIFDHKKNNKSAIDYAELEREFILETSSYRAELPDPLPPEAGLFGQQSNQKLDYEQGLSVLEENLPVSDSSLVLRFYDLQQRLRKLLRAEDHLNETRHSDVKAVIQELTRLSFKVTNLSFEQLCSGQKPK
jgi:hypothetical protein